jgi:biofilm regulator BssS
MADNWSDDEVRVLVGWTAEDFRANLVLRLETVTPLPQSQEDVLVSRLVLNKEQAVQLGNMLYELSGLLTPKMAGPSRLERMLSRKSD